MTYPILIPLIISCSNNTTEYEAVITRLELALQTQIGKLTTHGDSKLIVKPLCGEYSVKAELILYHKWVEKLITQFKEAKILHVHRVTNARQML